MAVKSFTAGITRQDDMDAGNTFSSVGGGPGASNVSAIRYQGTAAGARRINSANTDHGFTTTVTPTRDTTTAAFRNIVFKGFVKQFGDLNAGGIRFRLGSSGTAYHVFQMGDDGTIPAPGFQYPAKGGFVIKAVDCTLRAFLESTNGNPDETAIDVFGITGNVSATANGEDLALDALDFFETGFHAVGGDGADPVIVFDDFLNEDEGQNNASFDRAGLWTSNEGILSFAGGQVIGRTQAGTVTATEFEDSFETVVCRGDYVRQGTNFIEFDIGNASTTVSLDNITIQGVGRSGLFRYYDARSTGSGGDVDAGADTINFPGHGFSTGEQVLYYGNLVFTDTVSTTGGESELVTGTTGAYYYAINVDADTFAVATSFANALAGTRAALTADTFSSSAGGFERTPDQRPDITQTGTAGSLSITNSAIISARTITLNTNGSLSGTQLVSCQSLVMNGTSTIDNCIINSPTNYDRGIFLSTVPFIDDADPDRITNCTFIQGPDGGPAIKISTPGTYTLDGNDFQGYGADATNNAAIYNDSGGLVTLNVQNAPSTPTVLNGNLSSTVVNNTVTVQVTVIDPTGSPIENARVYVTAGTGGDLTEGTVILSGLTNASGVVQDTGFNFTNSQPITGRVRRGTTSPLYKTSPIVGTISSSGLDVNIVMIPDE